MWISERETYDEKSLGRLFEKYFEVKYDLPLTKEFYVGEQKRVDYASFDDNKTLSTIFECKMSSVITAVGQLLCYEFLLGIAVRKVLVIAKELLPWELDYCIRSKVMVLTLAEMVDFIKKHSK